MTNPSINDITNRVGETEKRQQRTDTLMIGLIVVLFIGFITIFMNAAGFIIDALRFKSETYQSLVNQISTQNTKIDILTNEVNRSNQQSVMIKDPIFMESLIKAQTK